MRELTHREQALTSFQWKPFDKNTWNNRVTRIDVDKGNDPNSICPYCKNEQTTPVMDKAYLNSYASNPAFKGKHYKVFSCHCCNAVFSWYTVKHSIS